MKQDYKKLDYTLKTAEERVQYVNEILAETSERRLTPFYLDCLSNYILEARSKEEKQTKTILTENRLFTIGKRETSFEGLISHFDGGEDAIYNFLDSNKNTILSPKVNISKKDLSEIADLQQLRDEIDKIAELEKNATGHKKYLLKKQLIEMRQDQYIIKDGYKKPVTLNKNNKKHALSGLKKINLQETVTVDENGNVSSDGVINLYDPKHISALLCNYEQLKTESAGEFGYDMYYLLRDLDDLINKVLKDEYPYYYDLVTFKINGLSNEEIQKKLVKKWGTTYTAEYLSSLWRNKIPKMLAEQAQLDYLMWFYIYKQGGACKVCSKCHQKKPLNSKFFSKNKSSKDGFYSICKECRKRKRHEGVYY